MPSPPAGKARLEARIRGNATAELAVVHGREAWEASAECRHRVVPVVRHAAGAAVVSATRPSNRVAPGLWGNDLLSEAGQRSTLPRLLGRPNWGVWDVIGPIGLHDAGALRLTVSPSLQQPQNPRHAYTPSQRADATIPLRRSAPNLEAAPLVAATMREMPAVCGASKPPSGVDVRPGPRGPCMSISDDRQPASHELDWGAFRPPIRA